MTFDQIQTFYMVATLGTYRRAAEQLNATQPTVSARILALEDRLGTRLFDRSGHRVALTPQGRLFLGYAEKLLRTRADALRAIGSTGELAGILRIGASDTMAITWIPDFLSFLRQSHPKAVVELHIAASHQLRNDILARQIDIAFMIGPVSHAQIVNHPLCACPMVLTAAAKLDLPARKLTTRDLLAHEIFTFDRLTRPFQDFRQHLDETGRSAIRLSPVNSLQAIILLVKRGLGIGAVPMAVIEKDVASGELTVLRSEIELPDLQFCISYSTGPDMAAQSRIRDLAKEFLTTRNYGESIRILY